MLQGSETVIDSQMPRVYDSRPGNKSRDASWKADMGNPGLEEGAGGHGGPAGQAHVRVPGRGRGHALRRADDAVRSGLRPGRVVGLRCRHVHCSCGGGGMAEGICPACGCEIGIDSHKAEGVIYCCAACAAGEQCECGQSVPEGESSQEQ